MFNGVSRDQILMNEKTLWSGRSTDNGGSYGDYGSGGDDAGFAAFKGVFLENLSGFGCGDAHSHHAVPTIRTTSTV